VDQAVKQLWGFVANDGAATAIEYGLIASFISIATALVCFQIGSSLVVIFQQVSSLL
jgi:Flp pilus assembly pilin Flp